jgi:3-isopropylmalate dehydratase small subunit
LIHEGRAWVFGDNLNTDLIIPGKYLDNYDPAHLASHAMESIRKEFAANVKAGDIIVAGHNFGCGSSREQAVIALKHAGISLVVAKSFARIFYRNAINLGMPAITSPNATDAIRDGDTVVVDIDALSLSAKGGRERVRLEEIPRHAREILDSGGLVPYIKRRLIEQGKA